MCGMSGIHFRPQLAPEHSCRMKQVGEMEETSPATASTSAMIGRHLGQAGMPVARRGDKLSKEGHSHDATTTVKEI